MSLTLHFLRILIFLLVAVPAIADEAAYFPAAQSPPALPAELSAASLSSVPQVATRENDVLLPVPAPLEPTSIPIASPGAVAEPVDPLPTYWMVSSRHSVQHIQERARGPWGLNAQEIQCDGSSRIVTVEQLSSSLVPGVPVCIFVHGSFVELQNQYVEAAGFYSQLRGGDPTPLQMIFFTWPSDGPYTGLFAADVAIRGRKADFNGFHLSYLISHIPEECPICLVGHSHGSRVILSSMHLAGGGMIEDCSFPFSMGANRRYRVILAAGALDHHWLNPGERFCCALNRVECLLNLQNRHDLALAAYPISRPFARRALARSGFTANDTRALGWSAAKLRDCDVTDLVGHKHYWPFYYRNPSVVAAMAPYIYFR